MRNDRLAPKRPLSGSAGQLWRGSTAWKLALVGAIVCTGLYLLNPPWQWKSGGVVVSHQTQQAAVGRPTAAAALPQQSVRTAAPESTAPATAAVPPQQKMQQPPAMEQPPAVPQSSAVQQPAQSAAPAAAPLPVTQAQPQPGDDPAPASAGITSQIAMADQNCGAGGPMRVRLNPPPAVTGTVVGFLPSAEAMALIPRSEAGANGRLDPTYVHNLRALFHPDAAPPNVHLPVVVPADMNIYVGEEVQEVGGHASPDLACHYVPNLIVAADSDP